MMTMPKWQCRQRKELPGGEVKEKLDFPPFWKFVRGQLQFANAHFWEVENQSRTIVVARMLRNVSGQSSLDRGLNQNEKCVGEICAGLDGFANPNQTPAWSSLWSILRATHNPRKRDLARWDDSLLCSLYPAFQLCAASKIYQRKFPLQLASNINRANSSPSWI